LSGGRDPERKLWKSAYLAKSIGATTVVVHPPFSWQNNYSKNFLNIVADVEEETGIEVAVENMFPWKFKNREVAAYAPTWEQIESKARSIAIDFSHAALSGKNALEMVTNLEDRVRHIHLCDGTGPITAEKDKIFDEHLLPGQGNQPVAETLQLLKARNWSGSIVAEVNTRKAKTPHARTKLLADTLEFARLHTS
jgi:sugar phosphate isomerase/epimerase